MRFVAGVLSVLSAVAASRVSASAQDAPPRTMKGSVGVGVTIGRVQPASDRLSGRTRVRPSLRRLPARGFGAALAFNWFDAEIDETFALTEGPFGRLVLRPVMVGIAYTAIHGRVAISPSLVAGPALATLDVDETLEDRFAVEGSGFERHVGRIAAAVRVGVTGTYALAPRLGVSAFGGYLWSRPSFMLATPAGVVRRGMRADSVMLDVGVVVSLF